MYTTTTTWGCIRSKLYDGYGITYHRETLNADYCLELDDAYGLCYYDDGECLCLLSGGHRYNTLSNMPDDTIVRITDMSDEAYKWVADGMSPADLPAYVQDTYGG